MTKPPLRYSLPLALCSIGLAIAKPGGSVPDAVVLRPNHLTCPAESDVARLAEISGEPSLAEAVFESINTGKCSASSMPFKVMNLVPRQSANGSLYYCYQTVDFEASERGLIEVPHPKIECSIPQHLTTLHALIQERSGDYEVIGRGPAGAGAKCLEGGRVTLRFQEGGVFRTSNVLPGSFKEDVRVDSNEEMAFRNGCKGVDALP